MGNLTDLKTVTWLEPCDFCSNTSLKVMTKNVDNSLNVLDQVFVIVVTQVTLMFKMIMLLFVGKI